MIWLIITNESPMANRLVLYCSEVQVTWPVVLFKHDRQGQDGQCTRLVKLPSRGEGNRLTGCSSVS